MTSSGLDDFFLPDERDQVPETIMPPQVGEAATAPRGVHAPSVPGAHVPGAPMQPEPGAHDVASPTTPAPIQAPQAPAAAAPTAPAVIAPSVQVVPAAPAAEAAPVALSESVESASISAPAPVTARPVGRTREQQLSAALATFMRVSADVEAAALVSLDGFIMASALPQGMHEDRVGAMSAAILGLGERAAAELGRGRLSQVFIEGDKGYVLLMAAGDRAVLTALARLEAKLGLLLYDMRDVAEAIADILG